MSVEGRSASEPSEMEQRARASLEESPVVERPAGVPLHNVVESVVASAALGSRPGGLEKNPRVTREARRRKPQFPPSSNSHPTGRQAGRFSLSFRRARFRASRTAFRIRGTPAFPCLDPEP